MVLFQMLTNTFAKKLQGREMQKVFIIKVEKVKNFRRKNPSGTISSIYLPIGNHGSLNSHEEDQDRNRNTDKDNPHKDNQN